MKGRETDVSLNKGYIDTYTHTHTHIHLLSRPHLSLYMLISINA